MRELFMCDRKHFEIRNLIVNFVLNWIYQIIINYLKMNMFIEKTNIFIKYINMFVDLMNEFIDNLLKCKNQK